MFVSVSGEVCWSRARPYFGCMYLRSGDDDGDDVGGDGDGDSGLYMDHSLLLH